jgi:hypothetical protein
VKTVYPTKDMRYHACLGVPHGADPEHSTAGFPMGWLHDGFHLLRTRPRPSETHLRVFLAFCFSHIGLTESMVSIWACRQRIALGRMFG